MAASARRPDGKPAADPAGNVAGRAAAKPANRAAALPGDWAPAPRRRNDRQAPAGFPARPSLAQAALAQAGDLVLRNPLLLGGGTAFLLALSFVSANAMWGQTQSHAGAFFPTRALPAGWSGEATTTGAIGPATPRAPADPTLRRVQAELGLLGLYEGALDGLPGPGTRKAVAAFQARNGLKATGELDGALVSLLEAQSGIGSGPASAKPATDDTPATAGIPEPRISKVQAGLKAFGIDGIEVDGIMGARTRAGVREFQAMFGLPETGEPDDALLAKMSETGLTH